MGGTVDATAALLVVRENYLAQAGESFLLKADMQVNSVKESELHLFASAKHLSIVAQCKGRVSFRGTKWGEGGFAPEICLPPSLVLSEVGQH